MFNYVAEQSGTQGSNPSLSKIIFAKQEFVETLKKITLDDVDAIKGQNAKFLSPDLRRKEAVLNEICRSNVIVIPFHAETQETPTPGSVPPTTALLVMEPQTVTATLYEQR